MEFGSISSQGTPGKNRRLAKGLTNSAAKLIESCFADSQLEARSQTTQADIKFENLFRKLLSQVRPAHMYRPALDGSDQLYTSSLIRECCDALFEDSEEAQYSIGLKVQG